MATRFPGAKTELYSEVIGQICLAFAIDKNKSMTMADFNLIELFFKVLCNEQLVLKI